MREAAWGNKLCTLHHTRTGCPPPWPATPAPFPRPWRHTPAHRARMDLCQQNVGARHTDNTEQHTRAQHAHSTLRSCAARASIRPPPRPPHGASQRRGWPSSPFRRFGGSRNTGAMQPPQGSVRGPQPSGHGTHYCCTPTMPVPRAGHNLVVTGPTTAAHPQCQQWSRNSLLLQSHNASPARTPPATAAHPQCQQRVTELTAAANP